MANDVDIPPQNVVMLVTACFFLRERRIVSQKLFGCLLGCPWYFIKEINQLDVLAQGEFFH